MEGKHIILLTDYKDIFGSKQYSHIYRGGMDIARIIELFNKDGFHATIRPISEVPNTNYDKNNTFFIYTSSEDKFDLYKSYIEDIILHLDQLEYHVIPKYLYLRAHNNKVSMELIRSQYKNNFINSISSQVFGSLDELYVSKIDFSYPVVIKKAIGAMSRGVFLANNYSELIKYAKKASQSFNILHDLKEKLRKVKYRNKYILESPFRNKFIVQSFIPSLNNDWKVLVYWNKVFILYRGNRKHDFRASGSGCFEFKKEIPEGILDFAFSVRRIFDVPNISLDVGYSKGKFYLFEFQFINFGTTTLEKSPFYFEKINNNWELKEDNSVLEDVYAYSIINFLNNSESNFRI